MIKRALIPALLIGAGIALAPSASASPEVPGGPCSDPGGVSSDGTLTCAGLDSIWVHRGQPIVQPGAPCDRPGDVAHGPMESVMHCRSGTWQR